MHFEADKTLSHFSTSMQGIYTYLHVDTEWESRYTFERCTADSADSYHWWPNIRTDDFNLNA